MSDKIKKLSQAIRLGATFRPQCQGHYFADGNISSCAMGAAFEACEPNWAVESIISNLPEIGARLIIFNGQPISEYLIKRFNLPKAITREIIKRNDSLGYTREEIADWLEAKGL